MVKDSEYYRKFKDCKEENLLKYFVTLNTEDWSNLFDDFFSHNTKYLSRIFLIPKGEDLYSYSLMLIDDVDPEIKNSITNAINNLLGIYYANNNFDKLKIIFDTTRFLELPIETGVLIELVQNRNIDKDIRETAAITLSVVYQNSLVQFWDRLDLNSDNFLIPSYIGFFKNIDPVKAIKKLEIITTKPENIFAFFAPVKACLLQLLISPFSLSEFAAVENDLPSWAREFIKKITQEYAELNDFTQKLNKIKQGTFRSTRKLQKVKFFRSVFPPECVVDVIKELGCFEKQGIDLEIEFAPWNQIFDKLSSSDVFSIIIGNERVCNYKNSLGPEDIELFHEWRRLIKYEGFAIVSKDKNLKNYKYFLDTANHGKPIGVSIIERKKIAFKSFLEQLKDHKIIASNNTDYFLTLQSLIEDNGLKLREFDIISDKDPYCGFLDFESNENMTIYIGSANLNQRAIANGCQELISEKHFNFSAVQFNSIITKNISNIPNLYYKQKELILSFFYAFNTGMTMIQDNKDVYLPKWFEMLNQLMVLNYPDDYLKFSINRNEFDEIVLNMIEYHSLLKRGSEDKIISKNASQKGKSVSKTAE